MNRALKFIVFFIAILASIFCFIAAAYCMFLLFIKYLDIGKAIVVCGVVILCAFLAVDLSKKNPNELPDGEI